MRLEGVRTIGTVIGVAQLVLPPTGFDDLIYSTKCQMPKEHRICNQDCDCSNLIPEDIISMDHTFSFPIYSSVFAIAHALHNVLQCGAIRCNHDFKVQPYTVSKKANSY
ncbi:hypothetical protein ATANTOWER_022796 [Ataeniobius toweri]|uniref:Uncharacterized protein n=1 Tax=Ataeniobius toweri TaxID=208326 RepID=A0ABU7BU23_9TELE|nr:hypothetical protein [Ataeniobius toweri]